MNYGIVVAGGQGTRFGEKKQYLSLAGKPMWQRAVIAMLEGGFDRIWLVVPSDDVGDIREEVRHEQLHNVVSVTAGGESRTASVRAGLEAIFRSEFLPSLIGVHDAARPFAKPDDIRCVINVAVERGGAILAQPCPDTVKRTLEGLITDTISREHLWLAQTPQVFRADWMQAAYQQVQDDATDDASVMERAGYPVAVVLATGENRKITSRADLEYAECLAALRWGGPER